MNRFVFSGNWSLDLQLSQLAQLKSDRFYKYEIRKLHREKLNSGLVSIGIYDEETEDPDPREEQIKCIDWIMTNQLEILETLYLSLKEKIFPHYINLWGDDPNNEHSYPKLNTTKDLFNALGMDAIDIHSDFKDNISYYTMYFNFCTDEEHGLAVTLHKERLIDFGGIGDMDNRKVIEDVGLNYDDWLNERLSQKEKKELKLYYPHEKYGKLKPWQKSANDYFPFGLLHANRNSDLINYLNANPNVLNENLNKLIEIAEYHKKYQLVKELKCL